MRPARLSVVVLSACGIWLASGSSALAAPYEQLSYVSDREHFEWEFRLDGFVETREINIFPTPAPGAGLDAWAVGVGFRSRDGGGVFDDLLFFAQHLNGPHVGDRGAQAFGHVELNYNTRIGLGGVGTVLVFDVPVIHQHTPLPNHQDVYFLGVVPEGGPLGAPYRFRFTGRHQGEGVPVPEPGSLILLASGLALCAHGRRRRGAVGGAGGDRTRA